MTGNCHCPNVLTESCGAMLWGKCVLVISVKQQMFTFLKHHLQCFFVNDFLTSWPVVYRMFMLNIQSQCTDEFLPCLDFPANVILKRESAAASLRPVTGAKQRAFVPLHLCAQRLKPRETRMLERPRGKVPFSPVKLWGKWRVCGD